MSFGFLFFLFSGDVTSFAGCYLTGQMPIQVNTDFTTPPFSSITHWLLVIQPENLKKKFYKYFQKDKLVSENHYVDIMAERRKVNM